MSRTGPGRPLRWVSLAVGVFATGPRIDAHDHSPPWLDPAALDAGLYVAIHYPRVIRQLSPMTVKVELLNVTGEPSLTVEHVRYLQLDRGLVETHLLNRPLPAQRAALDDYRRAASELEASAARGDVQAVALHTKTVRELLVQITSGRLVDRYRIQPAAVPPRPGTTIDVTIEIALRADGAAGVQKRVIRRAISIAVAPALPAGVGRASAWRFNAQEPGFGRPETRSTPRGPGGGDVAWLAGDQHLHTTYSLDALVLNGTDEDVTDYAAAAEAIGLDWIILTDHSNVHVNWDGTDYYTPEQFAAGTSQAADYTAGHRLLVLYGQEMGAGQSGLLALPSHYLAYPLAADSTGYLENPSSGLVFGLANCEPEQVIIDRVNDAGGFGFIAHPFDAATLAFAQWDFGNGATGWSGLEVWSDTQGQIKPTDEQARAHWYELLDAIGGPSGGELPDRPGFPNRFPVGLGNSDAHQPSLIGATFTYAWMPDLSREHVVESLQQGRCVASNGPLLFGELNGGRIGEVALLLDGDNELDLALSSTSEFGPAGDYELTVYVNGRVRVTLPPSGDPGDSITVRLENLNLGSPDTYVTAAADSANGLYHAITNPIWLQFTSPGDADADGAITLLDFAAFADCVSGPLIERSPSCDIMDFDRDRDVDLIDFAAFQRVFTGS